MNRTLLISGVGLTVFVTAGCATPVGAVRDAVSSAPEWYREARVEIRGEGYPDVSRLVGLQVQAGQQRRVRQTRQAMDDAEIAFLRDANAVPPGMGLEEMQEWADKERAFIASQASEDEFLTDEDIDTLRSVFRVRRAQS